MGSLKAFEVLALFLPLGVFQDNIAEGQMRDEQGAKILKGSHVHVA